MSIHVCTEGAKVVRRGESYQSDNLRYASAYEDEAEQHLGRWGLSQNATSGDATIWNLKRKESGCTELYQDAAASNQDRDILYIVPLNHCNDVPQGRKWMRKRKGKKTR